MRFVETVEAAVGRPAIRSMLPMQQGDVPRTFAAPDLLKSLTGFTPSISVEEGVRRFVEWYRAEMVPAGAPDDPRHP